MLARPPPGSHHVAATWNPRVPAAEVTCSQNASFLDRARTRPRWAKRVLTTLRAPWVVEMCVMVGLLVAYNFIRAAQGTDA